MLDARQLFKVAFMKECIDRGYDTPEKMLEFIKSAAGSGGGGKDGGTVGKITGPLWDLAKTLFKFVLIPAPFIVGGLSGYGLRRLMGAANPGVENPFEIRRKEMLKEVQTNELIDEYKYHTEWLKQQMEEEKLNRMFDRIAGNER